LPSGPVTAPCRDSQAPRRTETIESMASATGAFTKLCPALINSPTAYQEVTTSRTHASIILLGSGALTVFSQHCPFLRSTCADVYNGSSTYTVPISLISESHITEKRALRETMITTFALLWVYQIKSLFTIQL
jgi:hypothetical protein